MTANPCSKAWIGRAKLSGITAGDDIVSHARQTILVGSHAFLPLSL
jgi:hypothetical protein